MMYLWVMLMIAMPLTVSAASLKVIASIEPVHALVAGVMRGVGEPLLLLKGGASPHDYSLRPSAAAALNHADVVFWIGDSLERFLAKPLANVPGVRSVELLDTPGLELLALRAGGAWETHEHPENGHSTFTHGSSAYDPHIWLDPRNGAALVHRIANVLSELDQDHSAAYQANAALLQERLKALEQELEQTLAPVKAIPYVVFHDAYQYFERRFGLKAVAALTIEPQHPPGAKRVRQVRQIIKALQARCVFAEPQFEPRLLATLLEGTGAGQGVLDPLGSELKPGPDAYFELLHRLGGALRDCLSQ